ncbi:MAG: GntR family transcriptional regulator [Ilumatobacteraceae bacterium]
MSDRPIRYHVIADELRQRVRSMAPGRVLPSESDLSAEFAVSRVTVRRALEILPRRGARRQPPRVRLVHRHGPGAPAAQLPGHDRGPTR